MEINFTPRERKATTIRKSKIGPVVQSYKLYKASFVYTRTDCRPSAFLVLHLLLSSSWDGVSLFLPDYVSNAYRTIAFLVVNSVWPFWGFSCLVTQLFHSRFLLLIQSSVFFTLNVSSIISLLSNIPTIFLETCVNSTISVTSTVCIVFIHCTRFGSRCEFLRTSFLPIHCVNIYFSKW